MTSAGTRGVDRGELFALVAVLALAAYVRVIGLSYGLPAVYNPDEVAIMSRALAFATGDLNPHNFLYPTFYFYVLFAWIGGYFVLARLTGAVPSLGAFQASFFTDPSGIYLAGRTLGVVCGVATVLVTWMLARRLFGRLAAGVAALCLAAAPIAVRDAHYVKHDVPVTLLVMLAMLAIVRVWPGASARRDTPRGWPPASQAGRRTVERVEEPTESGDPARGIGVERQGHHDVHVDDSRTGRPLAVPAAAPLAAGANVHGTSGTVHSRRALIVAALVCGLAFSTHYYALFLLLPLLAALVFRHRDVNGTWTLPLADVGVAAAAFLVAFFAASPFLLVEPGRALADIVANRQIVVNRAGAGRGALFASAPTYARMLWTEAVGTPVMVLALAALPVLARRSWRLALLLLVFPVTFLLFISNTVAATRYLNPVLPFVAVLAGYAVSAGSAAFARLHRTRWPEAAWMPVARVAAVAGLVALAVWPGAALSLATGSFFREDDTRTLAQRFIEGTVPPGASILVQPYSVPLVQSRDSLVEALTANVGDPARASTKFALRLKIAPWPAPAYRTIYLGDGGLDADKIYVSYADVSGTAPVDALAQRGIDYVVLKRTNVPDPNAEPLAAALARDAHLLHRVTPYICCPDEVERIAPFQHNTDTPIVPGLARPGPTIEVWQLPRRTHGDS